MSIISVLIPVMIPARKQRCAPYDVDKVYFFAVQCRISSATKTSVNGPTRLNFRDDNIVSTAGTYVIGRIERELNWSRLRGMFTIVLIQEVNGL